MNKNEVKAEYLSLLKVVDLNEARAFLINIFNKNDIKNDVRRNDWIYLCEVETYEKILIVGSEFGESAVNFSSIFNHVDVLVNDRLDSKIVQVLSKKRPNIHLVDLSLLGVTNKYNLIYIDPSYTLSGSLVLFFERIKPLLDRSGSVVILNHNNFFTWSAPIKALNKAKYSIDAKYAWLPICDGSPMFVFDVSNKHTVNYFLESMTHIFKSVSPEYVKKYAIKIMILKCVKVLFFLKWVKKLFIAALPCYLIIAKHD